MGKKDGKQADDDNNVENDDGKKNKDILDGLNLSDAKKEELQSDPELLQAFEHNILAKQKANEEAKATRIKLEKFQKDKDEADAAKLEEQGEYKKLLEIERQQNVDFKAKLTANKIESELKLLAVQHGIINTDYIAMFDKTSISISDDGDLTGLQEAFESFVEANPALFTQSDGNDEETQPLIIYLSHTNLKL